MAREPSEVKHMKQSNQQRAFRAFILFAAACIGMLLAGCFGQIGSEGPNKSVATMRIAAVLPLGTSHYWEGIQSGLMSGAEGLDVDVKISVPKSPFDIPQMVELIKAATAARVDAIVAQGSDDPQYIEALRDASGEGILIAFVDTDITGFSEHLYVGTDNYGAGLFMAEKLVEATDGRTDVAVLLGGEGFPNLDLRLEGIRDGIAGKDGVRLAAVRRTNFDMLATIEIYRDILREEPSVDAIVCLDGSGGAAFSSAIGPSDASSMKIICFDMSKDVKKAIRDGVIHGAVVQSQVEMGEKAIQELHRCFTGDESLPGAVYTDIFFFTAAELEDQADEP